MAIGTSRLPALPVELVPNRVTDSADPPVAGCTEPRVAPTAMQAGARVWRAGCTGTFHNNALKSYFRFLGKMLSNCSLLGCSSGTAVLGQPAFAKEDQICDLTPVPEAA